MDERDERDIRQDAREVAQSKGIILQPWIVTLVISFIINAIGFSFAWGSVVTRLEAIDMRLQRMERLDDAQRERTRGVEHK